MGVSGFLLWLWQEYPNAFSGRPAPLTYDVVYYDLPAFLYAAARQCKDASQFHRKLHHMMRDHVDCFNARRRLVLAMDGPAPVAKILEQRRRRHQSVDKERREERYGELVRRREEALRRERGKEGSPFRKDAEAPLAAGDAPASGSGGAGGESDEESAGESVGESDDEAAAELEAALDASTDEEGRNRIEEALDLLDTLGYTPGTNVMDSIADSMETFSIIQAGRWSQSRARWLENDAPPRSLLLRVPTVVYSGPRVEGEAELKILSRLTYASRMEDEIAKTWVPRTRRATNGKEELSEVGEAGEAGEAAAALDVHRDEGGEAAEGAEEDGVPESAPAAAEEEAPPPERRFVVKAGESRGRSGLARLQHCIVGSDSDLVLMALASGLTFADIVPGQVPRHIFQEVRQRTRGVVASPSRVSNIARKIRAAGGGWGFPTGLTRARMGQASGAARGPKRGAGGAAARMPASLTLMVISANDLVEAWRREGLVNDGFAAADVALTLLLLAVLGSSDDYLPRLQGTSLSTLWDYYRALTKKRRQPRLVQRLEDGGARINVRGLASFLRSYLASRTPFSGGAFNGSKSGKLMAPVQGFGSSELYFRGLDWLVDMYATGATTDYRYAYHYASAPDPWEFLRYLDTYAAQENDDGGVRAEATPEAGWRREAEKAERRGGAEEGRVGVRGGAEEGGVGERGGTEEVTAEGARSTEATETVSSHAETLSGPGGEGSASGAASGLAAQEGPPRDATSKADGSLEGAAAKGPQAKSRGSFMDLVDQYWEDVASGKKKVALPPAIARRKAQLPATVWEIDESTVVRRAEKRSRSTPPLPPVAVALSLLPSAAKKLLSTPLDRLMDGESGPLQRIYGTCDDCDRLHALAKFLLLQRQKIATRVATINARIKAAHRGDLTGATLPPHKRGGGRIRIRAEGGHRGADGTSGSSQGPTAAAQALESSSSASALAATSPAARDGTEGGDGATARDGTEGGDGATARDGTEGGDGATARDGTEGGDGATARDGTEGGGGATARDGTEGGDGATARDGATVTVNFDSDDDLDFEDADGFKVDGVRRPVKGDKVEAVVAALEREAKVQNARLRQMSALHAFIMRARDDHLVHAHPEEPFPVASVEHAATSLPWEEVRGRDRRQFAFGSELELRPYLSKAVVGEIKERRIAKLLDAAEHAGQPDLCAEQPRPGEAAQGDAGASVEESAAAKQSAPGLVGHLAGAADATALAVPATAPADATASAAPAEPTAVASTAPDGAPAPPTSERTAGSALGDRRRLSLQGLTEAIRDSKVTLSMWDDDRFVSSKGQGSTLWLNEGRTPNYRLESPHLEGDEGSDKQSRKLLEERRKVIYEVRNFVMNEGWVADELPTAMVRLNIAETEPYMRSRKRSFKERLATRVGASTAKPRSTVRPSEALDEARPGGARDEAGVAARPRADRWVGRDRSRRRSGRTQPSEGAMPEARDDGAEVAPTEASERSASGGAGRAKRFFGHGRRVAGGRRARRGEGASAKASEEAAPVGWYSDLFRGLRARACDGPQGATAEVGTTFVSNAPDAPGGRPGVARASAAPRPRSFAPLPPLGASLQPPLARGRCAPRAAPRCAAPRPAAVAPRAAHLAAI